MMKSNLIKLVVTSMAVIGVSAPITNTVVNASNVVVSGSQTEEATVSMDKYQAGRAIFGDFTGNVTDIYLAKNGTVLRATAARIRNDGSYSISVDTKLSKDLAKNSKKYTVVAYGHNHEVIAKTNFNNGSTVLNSEISNVKYDKHAGVLTGNIDSSITSLKVSADGNKYNESFAINNGEFSARVSNDFYHDVNFGSHIVVIEGLDNANNVIAQTTIELG